MFRFFVLFFAVALLQGCFGTSYHWDAANQVREDAANAASGDIRAQFNLAYALVQGNGVQRDVVKAREIFEKIANMDGRAASGDDKRLIRMAQHNMGSFYNDGEGVTRNVKQAVLWYEKATEEGMFHPVLAKSYEKLGNIYAFAEEGDLRNAQKAVEYLNIAVAQGLADAKNTLGSMYEYGMGVERDYNKSFQLYTESANAGSPWGQMSVAEAYLLGRGVPTDYDQARNIYNDFVAKGGDFAKVGLAYMAFKGLGETKDVGKAKSLVAEVGKLGTAEAMYSMGKARKYGIGQNKDTEFAKLFLQDACRRGNQKACAELKK